MKKYILKSLLVLFVANVSFSQTTATDFTANDCNGVSHHLFDELDNGNVVVISWVMPCSPCATYSLPAYSAVQSFASSHPGRVHFYIADDALSPIYGSCSSLPTWGNSNSMPNSTFFQSADVNMNGYGVSGMPKVVVLGRSQHTIFYNQNNTNPTFSGVQNAIDSALFTNYVPTWDCLNGSCIDSGNGNGIYADSLTCVANCITNDITNFTHNDILSVFPNPTNDFLNISYQVVPGEDINFEIINILGETVFTFNKSSQNIGQYNNIFDISGLTKGTYFLKLSTLSHTEISRFVVAQ